MSSPNEIAGFRGIARGVALALLVVAFSPAFAPAAHGEIVASTDALALAHAMAVPGVNVLAASFVAHPGGTPTGVGDSPLAAFPRDGTTFAILTSGDARFADDPNTSGSTGFNNNGPAVRGTSDRDVVILSVTVEVPAGADCLSLDFQFLSDEFPEFVGSGFNDAFLAELGVSTWTTSGSAVQAPDNFAHDELGNAVTINAAGAATMTAEKAAGTTYDGATSALRASSPVAGTEATVFLSVFDMGDHAYDSAVFLDRLLVGTAGPEGCQPGALPPEIDPPGPPLDLTLSPSPGFVALAWQPPANDGGEAPSAYRVARAPQGGDFALRAEVDGETFTFTDDADDCADYAYRVSAVNSAGEGLPAEQTVMTPCAPGAPQNLRVERGPARGELSVAWDPPGSNHVLSYRLAAGLPGAEKSELAVTDADERAFLHGGLGDDAVRCYEVAAVNDVGEGPRSLESCGRTFAVPSAPTGLVARSGPGDGEVTLEWGEPADDGGLPRERYVLYRGLTPGGHSDPVTELGPGASSHVDGNLGDGTHFYYRLAAANEVGEGPRGGEAHGATFTKQSETQPEPLPDGVAHTSAAWQGRYAYVMGGVTGGEERQSTDAIVRFEPATGATERLDVHLPTPLHGTGAGWVDAPGALDSCHPGCAAGFVYLFGGDRMATPVGAGGGLLDSCHPSCAAGVDILRFDPSRDEVVVLGVHLPAPRAGTAVAGVPGEESASFLDSCHPGCAAGFLYLFGGRTPDASTPTFTDSCHPGCAGGVGGDILRFDPRLEQIVTMSARLPSVRSESSAVYAHDAVFLFGGHGHDGDLDEILRYDPATDTVSVMGATLPSPRGGTSAFWDGRFAYVVGGTSNGVHLDEILRYDPVADTVELAGQLPTPRTGTSVAFDGTTAHVFGGDDGEAVLDEVAQFTPTAPQNARAAPEPHEGGGSGGMGASGGGGSLVRATASGKGRILVSWEAPSSSGIAPLAGYRVYRGGAPDGETFLVQVGAGQTSFLDVGLTRGTTYFYKVSAVSTVGEGPQSREVFATTTDLPSAPRDLRAMPSGLGVVSLAWAAPATDGGEALLSYRLYRASAGLSGGVAFLGEVAPGQRTFDDPGCRLGHTCAYVVAAVNVHGQGPLSNGARAVGTAAP